MITTKFKKAIKHPDEAVAFLWYQAFRVFGHANYKQFIVLGRPRTGSNLLISFLNSHPNINAKNEIFFRLNGRDYREILNKTFSKQPPYIKAAGFKIFYNQPYDDKNSGLWQELIEMQQLHVIHLRRRNILRTLLSRKISRKTEKWEATNAGQLLDLQSRKVEFTRDELVDGFEKIRGLEEEFDDKFRLHPGLTVYYEELVRQPDAEFEKITDFLGLPFYKPTTRYLKMNPEKLSTLIANYDDLKREFLGTEWASFFEEDELVPAEL
ncbi:MAG: hypothetical protein BroJett011_15020 [Chloroflexota bacterium]|nr:MAG: hypothetical protein BroJett011_15020 [Chloroflexota bacterium]